MSDDGDASTRAARELSIHDDPNNTPVDSGENTVEAPLAQVAAPKLPRGPSNSHATAEALMDEEVGREDDTAVVATREHKARASSDERLMRIVLKKRPFNAADGSKLEIWNSVFTAMHGQGGNGKWANSRVSYLTKTLLDRPQSLTPAVRALVLEYNECYHKAGGRYCPDRATLQRLRRNARINVPSALRDDTSSKGIHARRDEPHELDVTGRDVVPMPPVTATTSSRGHAEDNDPASETELDAQVNVGPSRAAVLTTYDALLLRLVLDARPWACPVGEKQAAWHKVANAITEKAQADGHEITTTGASVERRVQHLCALSGNSTYGKWTPEVSQLVLEYKALRASDDMADAGQPRRRTESKPVQDVAASPTASVPRQRHEGKDVDVNGNDATASESEALATTETALRVALARQPFRTSARTRTSAWASAAKEVNTQLGVEFFKSGRNLESHLQRVLLHLEADPKSFSRKIGDLAAQYQESATTPAASAQQRQSRLSGKAKKRRRTMDSDDSSESSSFEYQSEPESESESKSTSDSESLDSEPEPKPGSEFGSLAITVSTRDAAAIQSSDELLMRHVLEVRPWTFLPRTTLAGWDKVIETIKANARENEWFRMSKGSSAKRRVRKLETTLYERLSPDVRALVVAYKALKTTGGSESRLEANGSEHRESRTEQSPSGAALDRHDAHSKRRRVVAVEEAHGDGDLVDDKRFMNQSPISSHVSALRPSTPHSHTEVSHLYIEALAAARAQSAQLIHLIELERHEFRLQNQALVELLRSEREAQQRETQSLLAAIDREGKDRRDEFVAMANLITRSTEPSTQPSGNHVEPGPLD